MARSVSSESDDNLGRLAAFPMPVRDIIIPTIATIPSKPLAAWASRELERLNNGKDHQYKADDGATPRTLSPSFYRWFYSASSSK